MSRFRNASQKNSPPERPGLKVQKRRMDLIPSVSRSGGLDLKDGNALTDFKVQEDYREFIREKIDDHWKKFMIPDSATGSEADTGSKRGIDSQENILILLRKLREGIVSSKRKDQFAIEVYETSLYTSIVFSSPHHTTLLLSYLLPDLYNDSQFESTERTCVVLLSLLHHLVAHYPSQSHYREHMHSLPHSFLPRNSDLYLWLSRLTSSLRTYNFVQFEELTRHSSWFHLLPKAKTSDRYHLPQRSLCTLLDKLRTKARGTSWLVLRSAYRELSCHSGSETREWLNRVLTLRPVALEPTDVDTYEELQKWLEGKGQDGDIRPREGITDRWLICKVR